MKKLLLFVAAICCMTFSAKAMDGAIITVANTTISNSNKAGFGVGDDVNITAGTVSYNDETHTLTLNGVDISKSIVIDASGEDADFTIKVIGNCYISTISNYGHGISFKGADTRKLIIEGDKNAYLSIMANGGSGDNAAAIFARKSYSETAWKDFYPLVLQGGMYFDLNNAAADGGATITCQEWTFKSVDVVITSNSSDVTWELAGGGNTSLDHMLPFVNKSHEYKAYAYTQLYPVWVNGYQLNDGKEYINAYEGMDVITSGNIAYDSETRTVYLNSFYMDADAEAALTIYDAVNTTDPITIKATGTSIINSMASGQPGLYVKSPVVINTNGYDVDFYADDIQSGVLLENTSLVIDGPLGGTLTLKGDSHGLYGQGTGQSVTINNSNVVFHGVLYEACSGPSTEFTANDVTWDPAGAHWSTTNYAIVNSSNTPIMSGANAKLIQAKITFMADVKPAAAGEIAISVDGASASNPAYVTAGQKVVMSVTPATGYDFAFWSDTEDTNPHSEITATLGGHKNLTAQMSRRAATDTKWYVIDQSKNIHTYGAKFRGLVGATVATLDGNEVKKATFANGVIYYVDRNTSSQDGIFSAEFNVETNVLSAKQTVMDFQSDKFFDALAMTYNVADNAIYMVVKNYVPTSNMRLVKVQGGEMTPIGDALTTTVIAMAANASGDLYLLAAEGGENVLYAVNKSTGELTKKGELNEDLDDYYAAASAMAFDSNGELILNGTGSLRSQTVLIDAAAGTGEWIDDVMCPAVGVFPAVTAPVYHISVAVASGEEALGDVNINGGGKSGAFVEGSTITLNAVPTFGNKFVKWNDDNTSASRSYTVTASDEGKTFTAHFAVDPEVVVYPVKVGEKQLWSGKPSLTTTDYAGVIKAGTISYNAETKTLTLDGAEIETTGTLKALELDNGAANGTIKVIVKGDCKVTAAAQAIVFVDFSNATLEPDASTAKLMAKGSDAIKLSSTKLNIKGLKTDLQGSATGISGLGSAEELTVTGANIEVTGTSNGSITALTKLTTDYCSIDANHAWKEADGFVEKTSAPGTAAKDKVTFTAWPRVSAKPMQEGTGTFKLTTDEGTFDEVAWVESGKKVTIKANAASGFEFAYWTADGNKDAEREYTITADKDVEALFYMIPKSSSSWYGVNDGKYVKFSLSDHGEEVAKANGSATNVKAGDFVDDKLFYVESTTVKARPFKDFEDGVDLEDAEDIKSGAPSGITDMAYDLKGKTMYAVVGTKLYSVDTDGEAEELGVFTHNSATIKIVAIAIDAAGNKYVLAPGTPSGVLYTIEEIDKEGGKVQLAIVGEEANAGKIDAAVNDEQQSLAFDHVTGELLWGAHDYLRIIDTQAMKAYIAGALKLAKGNQKAIKAMHKMDKMVSIRVQVADGQESCGTASVGTGSAIKADCIVNTKVTIVATPATGYKFKNWKKLDDTEVASEEASWTFTVKKKVTYVAYFEVDPEGFENVAAEEATSQKMFIDGQLYIIHNGRIYNAAGQLVK